MYLFCFIGKWSDNLAKPVEVDMIGTPDPISNLRPVRYYVSPNETKEVKIILCVYTMWLLTRRYYRIKNGESHV